MENSIFVVKQIKDSSIILFIIDEKDFEMQHYIVETF